MPEQDQTGPLGQGPMTGRGFGSCRGFRRGFGRGFFVSGQLNLTSEQEKKILEAELAELETEKKELESALKKVK
ncbi:MAG: DUF5320 domain-containing protein [archaeon]